MSSPFKFPSSCEDGFWETDRWGRERESDRWPEEFPKPRTCSYCGSVHPEDILALLKLGWEFEPSTKNYKSYWHPPGYRKHMDRVLNKFEDHLAGKISPAQHVDPTPPVKLYTNHVTPEQAADINALLLINRAMR